MRFNYQRFADELNAYLNYSEAGSYTRLVARAHVSHATLGRMRKGGCQNIDAILSVCKWISINPETLIIRD